MKAKSFQIKALKTQLHQGFDVVVLYGSDEGELSHALSALKQELGLLGRSSLYSLSKEALKKTPLLATDEANSALLMTERRFLFVPEDAPFTAQALLHFLEHKKTNALLIIQAGNLTKSNSLRLEAEKNPRVLAISCYQPTLSDIQKNILSFLTAHGKKINSSVLEELCQKIPLNQDVIEQELNKLLLYLGDQEEVNTDVLKACIVNGAEASLERLCIDLAEGRVEAVQRAVSLFLSSGESETNLFRVVRDYFEVLLLVISDTSASPIVTLKKYLKPSQFRWEDSLVRQANRWTERRILAFLYKIEQLEQRTRTTGLPKETIIAQAFLSLAISAK